MIQTIPHSLAGARYAVVIDGIEEIPLLSFSEMLVDTRTTLAVATLEVGEVYSIGALEIRRSV